MDKKNGQKNSNPSSKQENWITRQSTTWVLSFPTLFTIVKAIKYQDSDKKKIKLWSGTILLAFQRRVYWLTHLQHGSIFTCGGCRISCNSVDNILRWKPLKWWVGKHWWSTTITFPVSGHSLVTFFFSFFFWMGT